MFAGSNFDAEDFDDYNILQRDLMVDGGLRPVTEAETIAIRQKAARAIQAVFRELGAAANRRRGGGGRHLRARQQRDAAA
ncbi:hypothetical protein LNP05_28450 [Klebsiella pneumoniae subsp. pneumoniae]|nr:hypothetical protein [Klebsiella pneumoniae subsp. pneumoniae]